MKRQTALIKRGSKPAPEMMTPFAPVKACATECTSALTGIMEGNAELRQKAAPRFGNPTAWAIKFDMPRPERENPSLRRRSFLPCGHNTFATHAKPYLSDLSDDSALVRLPTTRSVVRALPRLLPTKGGNTCDAPVFQPSPAHHRPILKDDRWLSAVRCQRSRQARPQSTLCRRAVQREYWPVRRRQSGQRAKRAC